MKKKKRILGFGGAVESLALLAAARFSA